MAVWSTVWLGTERRWSRTILESGAKAQRALLPTPVSHWVVEHDSLNGTKNWSSFICRTIVGSDVVGVIWDALELISGIIVFFPVVSRYFVSESIRSYPVFCHISVWLWSTTATVLVVAFVSYIVPSTLGPSLAERRLPWSTIQAALVAFR